VDFDLNMLASTGSQHISEEPLNQKNSSKHRSSLHINDPKQKITAIKQRERERFLYPSKSKSKYFFTSTLAPTTSLPIIDEPALDFSQPW
jgi:hypothetical protein